MADLTTLIRLNKYELDRKRAALAALYAAVESLNIERQQLERALAEEKRARDEDGVVHFTFLDYLARIRRQQAGLDGQEALLWKQIEEARAGLLETFGELKKYQMTQEERDRLEAEERRLREAREMDAIGLENFRRRGGE